MKECAYKCTDQPTKRPRMLVGKIDDGKGISLPQGNPSPRSAGYGQR